MLKSIKVQLTVELVRLGKVSNVGRIQTRFKMWYIWNISYSPTHKHLADGFFFSSEKLRVSPIATRAICPAHQSLVQIDSSEPDEAWYHPCKKGYVQHSTHLQSAQTSPNPADTCCIEWHSAGDDDGDTAYRKLEVEGSWASLSGLRWGRTYHWCWVTHWLTFAYDRTWSGKVRKVNTVYESLITTSHGPTDHDEIHGTLCVTVLHFIGQTESPDTYAHLCPMMDAGGEVQISNISNVLAFKRRTAVPQLAHHVIAQVHVRLPSPRLPVAG